MPPSTQKIRPEDWERHKKTILDLWLHEKLPLKGSSENGRNLMQVMQDEHNFHATQYETKIRLWGAAKNLRKRDWEIILPLYNELERQRRAPRVRVGEYVFPESKVKRARREYLRAGLMTSGDASEQARSSGQMQTRLWRLEVRQDDGQYSECSNACLAGVAPEIADLSNIAQGDVQDDLSIMSGQRLQIEYPLLNGVLSTTDATGIEPNNSGPRLDSLGHRSARNSHEPISSFLEQYTLPHTLDVDISGYILSSSWENEVWNPITPVPFSLSLPGMFLDSQIESILRKNLPRPLFPSLFNGRFARPSMVVQQLVSLPAASIPVKSLTASSAQSPCEHISTREFSEKILYSFANNFAGLENVDFATVFSLLRLVPRMESCFLEWLNSDNAMISKPLAKNLFRAAIEAGDEVVVDIILKTTSGRINKINIDEPIFSAGVRYSPITLASSRFHTGVVKTLLLHGARIRSPNKASKEGRFCGCPLTIHIEGFNFPRDLLQNEQLKRIFDLIVTHEPSRAQELFVQILGFKRQNRPFCQMRRIHRVFPEWCSNFLEMLFRYFSKEYYPELLNMNISTERDLGRFAKPFESLLYHIITKLENRIANHIAQSLLSTHDGMQSRFSSMEDHSEVLKEGLILAILRKNTELAEYLLRLIEPDDRHLTAAFYVGELALIDSILDHGVCAHGRLMCSGHLYYTSSDSYWWWAKGIRDLRCPLGRDGILDCAPTTPLAEAIRLQNTQLIHRLENCGALDAMSVEGSLHFEAAALASSEVGNFSYLKQLLDLNPYLTATSLLVPIQKAIESRQVEITCDLITHTLKPGSNIRKMPKGDILSAIIRNHCGLDFLEQVMEFWDCFECGQMSEDNLLLEAVRINDKRIVEYLIHLHPSYLSLSTLPLLNSPLDAAVKEHNLELVRLLLERGAPHKDLRKAVATGEEAIVRLFLSHGAEPADERAFSEAVKSSNNSLLPILISAFSSRYPDGKRGFGGEALLTSVRKKDITALSLLLEGKLDVNSIISSYREKRLVLNSAIEIFEESDTILYPIIHLILEAGRRPPISVVELLQGKGADINRPARRGLKRTPLQQACEQGSFHMVKYLLERGADLHAPPALNGGATAMQLAAIQGNINIVRLLLDSGANIDEEPAAINGRTALQGAAEHGRVSVLDLLLVEGKDVYTLADIESAMEYAEGHAGCEHRLRLARFRFSREAIL
ncbi:unnamed protein product [Clonostachys rosea]|uniref:Clr5 domain-containing protein n=1 Tax=Bionectria ochroleuca TaxID=29856 RepID=A0ABY6TVA9_BIOOC|nr:unnamed protein product [Clonostachys rosea]